MNKEREFLKKLRYASLLENDLRKELEELLTKPESINFYQEGYAQAEIDLKREPLSDESICEILLKKEWRGFVDLVRIIEKAHGIGGE